ncbi:PIR protein, partial [Plasmodium vivax]
MPINQSEQISHKFYSRLDKDENISILKTLRSAGSINSLVSNNEIIHTLAKLARNINLIISEYPENHEKRCREVNHWLNEKIKTLESNKRGSDLNTFGTSVINDVNHNYKGKTTIVCIRENQPYKTDHAEIMKELDDYCEIRDNNGRNVLKNINECLNYNNYIKSKKEYFTSQINEKCNTHNCKRSDYKIDDYCTLDKMDDTFREINCDVLYKKAQIHETVPTIKERSPLEIGFFIIVSFILFYLFILFLEK